MATIEKVGNKYRIRKWYKKKLYMLSLDRKPTKSEAEQLIWSIIEKGPEIGIHEDFEHVAGDYIKSKDAVISPTTQRGYKSIIRNMPESFKIKPISSISAKDIQLCVNEYSKHHSAKSVRNLNGFITAVMRSVNPNFSNTSTLPQKVQTEFYVPEDEDIQRILDHSAGTRYEIPLKLAACGFRRSEICALTAADLSDDNIITVNKAKVQDDNGRWHIKTVKTVQSARKFKISDELAELIRKKDGYIYEGSPGQINEYLQVTQKKLGIKKFSLHKMRHYFASTAREVMPDSYVEKLGGWKAGSDIMKKVYDYQKKKQTDEAQNAMLERLKKIGI